MSVVTSIIIIFPYSENESERIKEVNEFEHDGTRFYFRWIDENSDSESPSNCYFGNKSFNSVVLLGSYNKFPTDFFLRHLSNNVKWENHDSVQVFINSEATNDRSFKIYSHAGKKIICDSLKF